MYSSVLILCNLIVWKIAQIFYKKDLSFWAGAINTGLALVALACCMVAKSIFYAKQIKRSEKQCTNFQLNSNNTDWIYDCRFSNLKGCKKWKITSFVLFFLIFASEKLCRHKLAIYQFALAFKSTLAVCWCKLKELLISLLYE